MREREEGGTKGKKGSKQKTHMGINPNRLNGMEKIEMAGVMERMMGERSDMVW